MDAEVLANAVRDKMGDLQARLLAKVRANLSGDVLQARTGVLRDSVDAELGVSAGTLEVSVTSDGVPYAAIQEYGGHTPAHEIVPLRARALAFAGAGGRGGGLVFARRVQHPGSSIPARAPFGRALDDLHDEILAGLKQAVRDALGAV